MKVIEAIKRLMRDPEFEFGNTLESRYKARLIGEREVAFSEGVQSGMEEGTKLANIKTARKLLSKMSLQEICDITGLSLEEVKNLK